MRTEACSPTLFPTRCYCSGIALRSGGLLWRKTHMAGHKWAHHWLDRIPTHVRSPSEWSVLSWVLRRGEEATLCPLGVSQAGSLARSGIDPSAIYARAAGGLGCLPVTRVVLCTTLSGDRRPLWGGKHGPVASVAETMCCGLLPHRCAAASP